jgi:hypothetical protein
VASTALYDPTVSAVCYPRGTNVTSINYSSDWFYYQAAS